MWELPQLLPLKARGQQVWWGVELSSPPLPQVLLLNWLLLLLKQWQQRMLPLPLLQMLLPPLPAASSMPPPPSRAPPPSHWQQQLLPLPPPPNPPPEPPVSHTPHSRQPAGKPHWPEPCGPPLRPPGGVPGWRVHPWMPPTGAVPSPSPLQLPQRHGPSTSPRGTRHEQGGRAGASPFWEEGVHQCL